MTAHLKIKQARAGMMHINPMIGAMALYLNPVEAPQLTDTMATDGDDLFFHPDYVAELAIPELQGIIAHETFHCMLGHHTRIQGRDAKRWNEAADFVVNAHTRTAGFKLPAGLLEDKQFAGMSAEEVYMRRGSATPAPQQQQGGQGQGAQDDQGQQGAEGQDDAQDSAQGDAGKPGQAAAQPGQIMPAKGKSQGERVQNAEEWRARTMQQAQFAAMAGTLPGDMAELVERLKHPQVDWSTVLRRFMTDPVTSDYSWARPSRRFIGQGIYLPSLRSEGLGTVVLVVDTSGSTMRYRETFATEFNAVRRDALPNRLIVISCDTRVAKVEEYGRDDPMGPLETAGNGGTDFVPPFEYLEREGIDPACLIYLTDLECSSFPVPPAYPVLWVSAEPGKAPFGEVVQLTG